MQTAAAQKTRFPFFTAVHPSAVKTTWLRQLPLFRSSPLKNYNPAFSRRVLILKSFYDAPILDSDDLLRFLRDLRVVGDKNNRTSLGVQTLEEHQDLKRGTGIQVAGSLVRQDHRRVVHQGTGDRHTLHLATGHLVAFMHQSVSQAHGDQGVDRLFPTLSRFIGGVT